MLKFKVSQLISASECVLNLNQSRCDIVSMTLQFRHLFYNREKFSSDQYQ